MARAALVAAVGIALLALARAQPSPCTKVFTVTELFDSEGFVVGPGLDPEDIETWVGTTVGYADHLVWGGSGTSGIHLGELYSPCFVHSVSTSFCSSTAAFEGIGSISFTGPFIDEAGKSVEQAITGGTGAYTGATGTVKITTLAVGGPWKYKFTLLSTPKC